LKTARAVAQTAAAADNTAVSKTAAVRVKICAIAATTTSKPASNS